ncbi:hypothetical protein ACIHCV_39755 [Streptomyces sp. NPDC051956]|uniref:hypothetical protein n=1 Tax=Streptomyces sp. NPDC051956 TaxID=3365677 RepID=UPI0037CDCF12
MPVAVYHSSGAASFVGQKAVAELRVLAVGSEHGGPDRVADLPGELLVDTRTTSSPLPSGTSTTYTA